MRALLYMLKEFKADIVLVASVLADYGCLLLLIMSDSSWETPPLYSSELGIHSYTKIIRAKDNIYMITSALLHNCGTAECRGAIEGA